MTCPSHQLAIASHCGPNVAIIDAGHGLDKKAGACAVVCHARCRNDFNMGGWMASQTAADFGDP